MLLTVVDFPVQTEVFKLAEMPFGVAKKHGAEGRALLERGETVTNDEWYERVLRTVLQSIERAGATDWTVERLENELGKSTIDAMYMKVLEISGMRSAGDSAGEVKAT